MQALLVKIDLWTYVSEQNVKPGTEAGNKTRVAAIALWNRQDEKTKSEIILSKSAPELKQGVCDVKGHV